MVHMIEAIEKAQERQQHEIEKLKAQLNASENEVLRLEAVQRKLEIELNVIPPGGIAADCIVKGCKCLRP